jgi:hypothetical protein
MPAQTISHNSSILIAAGPTGSRLRGNDNRERGMRIREFYDGKMIRDSVPAISSINAFKRFTNPAGSSICPPSASKD